MHASETNVEHVLNAHGYVFIAPETLGKLTGRPYAVLVCTHAQTPEKILAPKTINPADLQRCCDLGAALASGLAVGLF